MSASSDKRAERRVKIVCTLGPASSQEREIAALIDAGMDVARLNFSHGEQAHHAKVIEIIRKVAQSKKKYVAILQDLQGPKLRLGALPANGVDLFLGEEVVLFPEGDTVRNTSVKKALPLSREIASAIAKDVRPGAKILFDDGKVATIVTAVRDSEIVVRVEVGGVLTSRKGLNLPGTPLSVSVMTDKDLDDLKFGLAHGVDAVALSFVRSASDIESVREMIRTHPKPPTLFAKIEREEAIRDREAIMEVADGLLIARGDMAVEIGADRVPVVQKELIRACNELGVPVITATQMLESMVRSPTPTRAEANDVANAVFDGTDAVMLSAETASGSYPEIAVRTMDQIVREAERHAHLYAARGDILPVPGSVVDSIEFSAGRIAHHTGARAILCITHTGRAALALAKFRPATPIIAIVDQIETLRKLAPVWGVRGVHVPKILATDDLFQMIETICIENGIAAKGDTIVVTAGIPSLRRGTTNMVKVHKIGDPQERLKPL